MATSINKIAFADKIDSVSALIVDVPYFPVSTEKLGAFEKWLDEGKKLALVLMEVK
jgi:hypothetical protein